MKKLFSAVVLSAFGSAAFGANEIDSADFSGSETIVDFAGLSQPPTNNLKWNGVKFMTADGRPYLATWNDTAVGRIGPADATALNNFSGPFVTDYPDLIVELPKVAHRFGVELRTQNTDATVEFTVLLASEGTIVDSIQIGGDATSNTFEFYGFETSVGFDSVLIDVPANTNGAFSLDNLRFEINPAVLIENLAIEVALLNLHHGIDNSLDAKLDAALNALDDVNENNDAAACNSLWAFVHAVDAQAGKKIDELDALYLIDEALAIIAELGC